MRVAFIGLGDIGEPMASHLARDPFDLVVWNGLFAPRGTPKPVLDKLVVALQAALQDATFRTRLADLGAEPVPLSKATPDSLRALLKAEVEKWTPIIRKTGAYAD